MAESGLRWASKIAQQLRRDLVPLMKKGMVNVPKHLKSVPEFQKYMYCGSAFPMMFLLKVKEEGLFLQGVNHACPAAYLVIDE